MTAGSAVLSMAGKLKVMVVVFGGNSMDDNHQVADAVRPEAPNCGCPMRRAASAGDARQSIIGGE
jgi:hypothetical protein